MAKQQRTMTDEELKAALVEREIEKRRLRNSARQLSLALVLQHVEVLLQLVPSHGPTSCDDNNVVNGYEDHGRPRCARCRLLEIRRDGVNEDTVLDVQLMFQEAEDTSPDRLRVEVLG